jgi:hypothetical protein
MFFNPTELLIDAFVERLECEYHRMYGVLEPAYAGIIAWAGRMALENIANSDALYHDVEHTLMVTLVGQEILKGKHVRDGGVSPRDWMHFVLSLLCHDIGYVRGVCREDRNGTYTTGKGGETVEISTASSDAALTPYHVDRGKRYVRERFGTHGIIDAEIIATNIEHTRFPVPHDNDHESTSDYPGLLRAADLIGQLASPNHMRKFPALFYEFEETGVNASLGYKNPGELRDYYPTFFWKMVTPYIQDALRCLRVTESGKQWIANLYAHVFVLEHQQPWNL